MRKGLLVGCIATLLTVLWGQPAVPQKRAVKPATVPLAAARATIDQYCVSCHNQKAKIGGLQLDKLDLSHVGENAETWEKVVRKLRAGMMPPAGVKRPDSTTYEGL